MKYTFMLLTALCFAPLVAYSQILNGGFEDWTDRLPDHWTLFHLPQDYFGMDEYKQDSDAHSGHYNFFFNYNTSQSSIYKYAPFLTNYNPDLTGGIRIPPGKYFLSFWKKIIGDLKGSAEFDIVTAVTQNGTIYLPFNPYGIEASRIWTKETLNFEIPGSDSLNEDTLKMAFSFSESSPNVVDVSLYLDDITLEAVPSSIPYSLHNNSSLSVTPTPTSSHANLKYHADGYRSIGASIFDLTGRKVIQLPALESATGDGAIPFDVDGLPNGMYYLRFDAGGEILVRKITVQH